MLDTVLIIIGAACSTWFISTDGNGQNLLPVAAGMVFVSLITGMVSFVLARFVRTIPLSISASVIVTDLLFVLYLLCLSAFSKPPRGQGNEELVLLPMVFAVETAPAVLLAAIGFGRIAGRFHQKRNAKPDPDV